VTFDASQIRTLDERPARPLTSREIARAVAGLLGSFATWCDPRDIRDAMSHFYVHADMYRQQWELLHEMGEASAPAQPGEDS
jgi:hypothetical protein